MWKEWMRRWEYWRHRERLDRELAEEMETHIAMKTADGSSPGAARKDFGNLTALRERSRDEWTLQWIDALRLDVRYALRSFSRNPGFALLAIGAMAIAIGSTTAIFSLAQAVLLRPLPFPRGEELTMIFEGLQGSSQPARYDTSPGAYRDFRTSLRSLHSLAAFHPVETSLTGSGEPERLDGARVTDNFFSTIGVPAAIGLVFVPGEEQPGRDDVVVLSHDLWERRFASDSGILGRKILLGERPYTVIGVMPPGFRFYIHRAELWTPLALDPARWASRNARYIYMFGRRTPETSLQQVQQELGTHSARMRRDFPKENRDAKYEAASLHEKMTEDARAGVLLLLGAVIVLLLIACSNVANLLLSRAAGRSGELAVRSALGAGASRLFRQLLTESMMLALLGGAAGLAVAHLSFLLVRPLVPDGMLAFTHLQLDGGVVGIALALSAFATLASGLVPSLRALRSDVKLREATLRIVRASRLGKVFVVIQVALAVVLLVGAGLLLRTVWNMTQVDPGFRPAQLLTAQTILGRKYSDPALRTQFYSEVLARVKSLPGVVDAAYGTTVPTAWKGGFTSYSVDGQPFSPGRSIAMHRQVTPSYFSVMGIRLLQGRLIDENDTANTPPVAVINQTMAKRVWGGLDPVGKQFRRGSPESQAPLITVVGVVEDVLEMGLTEDAPAITYFSQRQQANATFSLPEHLLVRTQGEPSLLGEAVRRTILSVNPNQPIAKLMPATAVLDREWKERRIHASLIGAFAGAALLLAAIGIHGVLAYMVVRRRPELGLRLSLGAQPADLMRMVLSEGMRLVLIGAVIGTAASAILARSMQSLLFQVRPADPSMVAAGAGVLLIVALVACWVPARRTLRISPAESLRLS